ncbi:hypothetical protein U1737_06685 [Sphingomonas sp. LB3N6]|uniref:hypothetical protein n=1 Tax=Sphingomonas fucosidasi TaxID=3096164 RepID=UPI002FCB0CA4
MLMAILPGELLVTVGLNGVSGTIYRYRRLDYGGLALVAVDTLNGADAIEGIWIDDTDIRVGNDAATHSGSPRLNRIDRYADDSHA